MESERKLGQPIDRLASAIVDFFIVLMPVGLLFTALLRREMARHRLLDHDSEFMVFAGLTIFVTLVIIYAYQVVSIKKFGGTLGQFFLGLRIVDAETGAPLTWSQACVRQAYWIFATLPAGLLHVPVFHHKLRRPIYDRIAETIVVSKKTNAGEPTFVEKKLSQLVYTSVVSALCVIAFYFSFYVFTIIKNQTVQISEMQTDGELCEEVGEAEKEWPLEKGEKAERLSVAMGLYAAGLVNPRCLNQELEWHFQQGYEDDLAYLAGSFVYADQSEISDRYLAQVCVVRPNSEVCHLSRIVDRWSESNWALVDEEFEKAGTDNSVFFRIWKVRHLFNQGRYELMQKELGKISKISALGSFLSLQKIKSYWGQSKFAESLAMTEAYGNQSDEADRLEANSWVCAHSLMKSCDEEAKFNCESLLGAVDENADLLADAQIALSFVKHKTCENKTAAQIQSELPEYVDPGVYEILEAMKSFKKGDEGVAEASLRDLVIEEQNERLIRFEAMNQLVNNVKDITKLDDLFIRWQKQPKDIYWGLLGDSFLARYKGEKLDEKIVATAEELGNLRGWTAELSKPLVVSLHKLGKNKKALEALNRIDDGRPARGLASAGADEFESIASQLRKSGGE